MVVVGKCRVRRIDNHVILLHNVFELNVLSSLAESCGCTLPFDFVSNDQMIAVRQKVS